MAISSNVLFIILVAVGAVFFIVAAVVTVLRDRRKAQVERDNALPWYNVQRDFPPLNGEVLRYHDLLQEIVGGYLHVISRVLLDEIVEVNPKLPPPQFAQAQSVLARLRADYVLYEPHGVGIACVIQLDRSRTRARFAWEGSTDVNVTALLEEAGLKVIRLDAESPRFQQFDLAARESITKQITDRVGALASREKTVVPPVRFSLYRGKRFAMSELELQFYWSLVQAVDGRYLVGFKVRLADIVELPPSELKASLNPHFQRIAMKHVDYVLLHRATGLYAMVIELDDSTHDEAERIKRDNFLDGLLLAVGVPVIHHEISLDGFQAGALRKTIDRLMKEGQGIVTVLANGGVIRGSERRGSPKLFGDPFRKPW